MKILADYYSELELPVSSDYIGARVLVCEAAGVYSKNLEFTTLVAEDGDYIAGLTAEGESTEQVPRCKVIKFVNGAVELLGVPKRVYTDDQNYEIKTKWVVLSITGLYHGYK